MAFQAWYVLLLAVTAVLFVPLAVLCVECLAAMLPPRRVVRVARGDTVNDARPRVAVLVPARNEEAWLAATLATILPQLRDGDRVLVVADNCSDATAVVARRCGAAVIERTDAVRVGKGYALQAGVDALAASTDSPPDVLVIVDADTTVHPGAIDALARQAGATDRPAQAVYVLQHDARRTPGEVISAVAFLVKNLVRPRGLLRLGLPCQLTGSGMAIPWNALADVPLGGDEIVEDMHLGIELALRDRPPQLCLAARVSGSQPRRGKATARQRTRWVHGHLRTALTQVPRLALESIRLRRPALLALALDLAVPPVSLLALLLAAAGGAVVVIGAVHEAARGPAMVVVSAASIALVCAVAVWFRFARDTLSLAALAAIPLCVCQRLPIFALFLLRPERRWIRTDRTVPAPEPSATSVVATAMTMPETV